MFMLEEVEYIAIFILFKYYKQLKIMKIIYMKK